MRPSVTEEAFAADFELDAAQQCAIGHLTRTDRLGGAYLWGPVGRGKTWLLDRYFDGVQTTKKRVHFHSFFRDLHASHFRHGFSIDAAIDELLGDIDLLCFDEFHVHDIGDGRLIARMLDALFARDIALVVTSNYAPDDLMPNPLFHDAFVPTISVMKKRLRVIRVAGPVDYRTRRASVSHFSTGAWTTEPGTGGVPFEELCQKPRSSADYLALVENAQELTITDVPALATVDAETVQRFSNLIDILYDRDIATTLHATVDSIEFASGCVGRDIDRVRSRLCELRHP
jgi:cell division protein ZapE